MRAAAPSFAHVGESARTETAVTTTKPTASPMSDRTFS
jgi:hypothetical protein